MAITTQAIELVDVPPDRTNPEHVGFTTADASGAEEIIDAPGSGRSLFIQSITLTCNTDITIDIGAGEGTSAVQTQYFPTIVGAADSGPIKLDFGGKWLKMTANKALVIDASGAGNISGHVVAVQDSADTTS